jgi:hypothetical protein
MQRTIGNAIVAVLIASLTLIGCARASGGTASDKEEPSAETPTETVEFTQALLRVEINATDGDAGLQIDLDHDPWSSISLTKPDGQTILEVENEGVLKDYGLTELFSESSEPPFSEFPLSEFKKLFPAGEYVFEGRQIDGTRMRSTFTLTHNFPEGPVILSPEEGSTVAPDALVVEWEPGTQPAGIEIVRYQVLVVSEADPVHTFSTFLSADASSIAIPPEFLSSPGEYKVEVLAIERSGNQTLTEITFTVG